MEPSSTATLPRYSPPPPRPWQAKDEMNLATFPIALLSDRVPDGLKTLEYHDTILDPTTKEPLTRKLTVSASDKYGLPTAADDEVILGLIQLSKLDEFNNRKVSFSCYQLLRILGWADGGRSYQRLRESLHRWVGVTLYYENAWRNNQAKRWVSESFHILDNVRFSGCDETAAGRKKAAGESQLPLPLSFFVWNETVFKSFTDSYIKDIDWSLYRGLRYPMSKRIYRFLDKDLYPYPPRGKSYDLRDFACEHVGLSRSYNVAQLRRKLAPAIAELETAGFLRTPSTKGRYTKVRRGEWQVVFAKPTEEVKAVTTLGSAKVLTERGVTAASAAEIAATYTAEQIAAKIDVFDWLKEQNDQRLSKNPAGYLVESIRKDYAAPAGFEPADRRTAKKQAAEQRRQQKLDGDLAKRQREEREAATRKAERRHIESYLKGLTKAELQALEEQAIANGDASMQESARAGGSLSAITRRLLVDREVLRLHPLPTRQLERV